MILLLACAAPMPTVGPNPDGRPDLVVILVPGLGADREAAMLGPLGPPTVTFPTAWAQSTATVVSAGSLLTGTYASAIPMCGLYDDGTHPTDTTERAWCATLPPSRHTLPEVLGLYGYRTALFTAGLHGADAIAAGFGTVQDIDGAWPHRDTPWPSLREEVGRWWSAQAGPRLLLLVLPELLPGCRPSLADAVGIKPGTLDAGDGAAAEAALTARAAAVGAELRGLLDVLPDTGPRWVVVSSTHGLSVTADTGLMGGNRVPALTHNFLLERTVHVPLVIYGPTAPRRVDQVVELVDVFPTLAALAGATPPAGLPGEDLLAITEPRADAWAYAEFGEFLALREGPMVLSFRSYQHHPTALDPQITESLLGARDIEHFFRLHDVVADPLQVHDLAAAQPELFAARRAQLVAIRTGVASPPKGSIDARKLWELRMSPSQGYW